MLLPGEAKYTSPLTPERRFIANNSALAGILHAYVAFDWGEEIYLDQARRLQPTGSQELARRRRTNERRRRVLGFANRQTNRGKGRRRDAFEQSPQPFEGIRLERGEPGIQRHNP